MDHRRVIMKMRVVVEEGAAHIGAIECREYVEGRSTGDAVRVEEQSRRSGQLHAHCTGPPHAPAQHSTGWREWHVETTQPANLHVADSAEGGPALVEASENCGSPATPSQSLVQAREPVLDARLHAESSDLVDRQPSSRVRFWTVAETVDEQHPRDLAERMHEPGVATARLADLRPAVNARLDVHAREDSSRSHGPTGSFALRIALALTFRCAISVGLPPTRASANEQTSTKRGTP